METTLQLDERTCNAPIVQQRESVFQCQCLHGKCVYHNDEKTGQKLMGCVCIPGYQGENCDQRSGKLQITKHTLMIGLIILSGLLLSAVLLVALIQMKRRGRLQNLPTMPGPIQTTIDRFRNLVTRSNNNINTIRFRNARMTTASGASSTESPPVFANPMFGATISNEPAKLDVQVQKAPAPPTKPNRKSAPAASSQQQHFDPQSRETEHDKANLVVRSSSSDA